MRRVLAFLHTLYLRLTGDPKLVEPAIGSENCGACAEAWENSGYNPTARCWHHRR